MSVLCDILTVLFWQAVFYVGLMMTVLFWLAVFYVGGMIAAFPIWMYCKNWKWPHRR